MREVFEHKMGKHVLFVSFDKEEILKAMEEEKANFDENNYVRFYQVDDYLTREEYEENLDDMIETLNEITTAESLKKFIEDASKKRNGTFYKGRVVFQKGCDNTVYFTEWHNTWAYNALKVKAISDKELNVSYVHVNDTPA